jgi:hypothetical protein
MEPPFDSSLRLEELMGYLLVLSLFEDVRSINMIASHTIS